MIREIGSEFWLDNIPKESQNEVPNWLSIYGDTILASSGRGAISLLLQQVTPRYKSVLLPAYICDSVILPFIEQGYSCYFYKINNDLSPNIESIKSYENIGLFLHMGYYGFSTNSNLLSVLQDFKEQSVIIIEDITHTLFSSVNRFEENDFYVGSIRKWFGLPGGGFISSSKRILKRTALYTNDGFSKLRIAALAAKGKYVKTRDENLKDLFLNQFSRAESLLDRDVAPYCIDGLSMDLINFIDSDELVSKRRMNFKTLSEGLKSVSYLDPFFNDLTKNACPLFYPVMIKNNRDDIKKKLAEEKIYCPVHWPVSDQIKDRHLESTLGIYNSILSIPCDQRYGIIDMERIISVLKCL
ncbi:DegT/DnrJ/EryC1/StrS family aminotransferase [Peribacillus frigoritolerans]|uniref:DegT/DnrJ/EryC1/StrS family aminotransferase n=1 Tax=Peribacillus frigoritolerans TaxID=450367 RepID=UPI0020A1AB4A|nr:DegT/DnrJ/EryC1/StrS family aminotransferase [Peribacillus frigoritolerans]MCP1154195.1 DegT/DnrJ/EryC1/StrS family aminotransferase [Peribacillus frigoritolerans]